MPTLNVCVQKIYMNKKTTKFIKSTNISLPFRSFVLSFPRQKFADSECY